ncbi:hypothetical protein [uncultured Clostridium sp.]|uniref:ComF family protein n=1 Tax=uncultured Clostridium sp. TaxID=59620 RepID=UPI002617EBAD|nr:hypothetical protein [uncultured Clostridium sp.]
MEGLGIVKYLFNCLLEIVYPRAYKCISCKMDIDEDVLCSKCLSQSSEANGSYKTLDIEKMYSCRYYSDSMRKLIVAYKSKKNFEVGEYFIKILIDKIEKEKIEFDLITFVPSSKVTIRKRGFDHGRYLAKGISSYFNKEIIEILYKTENSKEQKKLSAYERRKNMESAFKIIEKKSSVDGKRILFIDDILTTGYTVSICKSIIEKSYKVDIIPLTVIKSSI